MHLRDRKLRKFGCYCDTRSTCFQCHGENLISALRERSHTCHILPFPAQDAADWRKELAQLALWLKLLPKPVGVMTCFDLRGQEVFDICRTIGLRVPVDMVAIGHFPVLGTHAEALMARSRGPDFHSLRSKPISANHRKIVTSSRSAVSCIGPASSLFPESRISEWKEKNRKKKPDENEYNPIRELQSSLMGPFPQPSARDFRPVKAKRFTKPKPT